MNPLILLLELLVLPMGRTGTPVGGGVQAREWVGGMGQALGDRPMGLEEVLDLGLVPGQGRARDMAMGREVVVLMVVGMGLEVGLATLLLVAMVEETVARVVAMAVARLIQMLERGTTMADELVWRLGLHVLLGEHEYL